MKKHTIRKGKLRTNQGFSMLEVLISLVLLTSVLLGATAMQLTSLQNNRGAFYRSQASIIAADIADRIRVNSSYAASSMAAYSFNSVSSAIPANGNCITAEEGCTAASLAQQDLREWAENFSDVAGVGNDNSNYTALLPGGSGSVTASGAIYMVQVNWTELDWNITTDTNKALTTKSFTLDFSL
ncbi:type IV pilus modification protein PilV [Motiliproteus sp. MSK22-1]|uniref:type IV pilus modification protein PilV n=1 Tax=Motiliproteus sp. MSK22-1 TaxID=1897630 RepID=UPI0009786E6A|nr:type IV pilus modification protein PilV [Motiliproteus sp. MSK22-1]OMH33720.1 type IV pilus modification protein PilV [Motiliproteus sp. MSK22-1]